MSLAEHVVTTARRLAERGLSPGGSGNLSVRVGDRLLITPTGGSFSRLQVSDLAVLTRSGEHVDGPPPSKEWPLHVALYDERPDARAAVHLHSPHATALACLEPDADGVQLPLLTPYQRMKLGHPLVVADYAPPGSSELAESIRVVAGVAPALLMANHGLLTAGPDLDSAADLAEELEAAARVFFTVGAHAGRGVRLLS